MSATKLAQLIREKKISSLESVKACQARIAAVNPKLNAVIELCAERALLEAKHADTAQAKGQIKGPLHGVPMSIKDSFDTAGVVSTGGTLGRKTYIPGRDATVVARLREAGAILLGRPETHGRARFPHRAHFWLWRPVRFLAADRTTRAACERSSPAADHHRQP